MGIKRLIELSLLLAAIVLMTGIAGAQCTDPTSCDTLALWDSTGTTALGPGSTIQLVPNGLDVPLTVRVTFGADRTVAANPLNDPTHSFDYTVDVLNDPGGALPSDITLTAQELTCDVGFVCGMAPAFPMFWYQSFGLGGTEDLRIAIASTGPEGAKYNIILDDLSFGDPISFQTSNLNATNIFPPPPVPELSTSILMSVGLTGMLLLIRSRK